MDPQLFERLASNPGAPRQARASLTGFLAAAGCDALIQDAALLVSEVVTNAVCHGSGPIELRAQLLDGVLRVEVHDESSTLPSIHVPNGGGRGLHIVAAIATTWGSERYEGDGKVTWFELEDLAPS